MVKRSVFGKEYKFTEMKVDIFKLKYYPENPRVHHIIHGLGKNPTQDQIEKTMWGDDNTKDLFWDIKQNGLQDPILISEDYRVMEGNTRLCAFRNLFYQAKEKSDKEEMGRWRYIQCEMYPPGLDKLGMFYMLGRWHIKQKTPWDAFEKASYMQRLMKEFNKTVEEIADDLKIKKQEIEKMMWVKDIMTEEKVTNIKQYSHFEQCYQKPVIRKKMDKERKFRKKIVNLIKSGNLGRAENIRKLPTIIDKKEDGLDLLEKGVEFEKVWEKALEESPDDNPIFKYMEKLIIKLDKLDTVQFFKEMQEDRKKIEIVNDFFNQIEILKKLCKEMK